ncbi:peptidase M23 family protein [Streptomyces sp. NBRC 110611]|nr:peptidase M23 family protein [Streptomyces sp. NBRC 110611]
MLAGALCPSHAVAASNCADPQVRTLSDVDGSQPETGSVHVQRIANLNTFGKVAGRPSLSPKRLSTDWDTKEAFIPEFATESFSEGHSGNAGMLSVKNWRPRTSGDVAQVDHQSVRSGLYAGHKSNVWALVGEADIDLDRGSTMARSDIRTVGSFDNSADSGVVAGHCPKRNGSPRAGGRGRTFNDGRQRWRLPNPRSIRDAIAWAKAHSGRNSTTGWYRRCLAFSAIVYGWNYSGVNYAIDHFSVVPKNMRHPDDRTPPPGALLYWDTGHRAGHIAVYLGGGKAASNDILRLGYIDIVDASLFEMKWGAKYLGWTAPIFPRAG